MSWISFMMSMKPAVSLSARFFCSVSSWEEDGVSWGAALMRAASARMRVGREKRMVMVFGCMWGKFVFCGEKRLGNLEWDIIYIRGCGL
jgi:hypothetical protein